MITQKLNELIVKWLEKPTFKLEETVGFEEHREKLLRYRLGLQRNTRIKALQQEILRTEKEKWEKLPKYTLEDDPELNLFYDELKAFCEQKAAEWQLQNNINLFADIQNTFWDIVEKSPGKSMVERIKIVRMYKNIDLSIIKPNVPGLDDFKLKMMEWVEEQENELGIK